MYNSTMIEVEKCCWEAIFYATIWSIWKARNNLIFSATPAVKREIFDLIKFRVAFWVKVRCNLKDYSITDIYRNLQGIRKLRSKIPYLICIKDSQLLIQCYFIVEQLLVGISPTMLRATMEGDFYISHFEWFHHIINEMFLLPTKKKKN